MFTFEKFIASTALAYPPEDFSIQLQALWWDKKGNWQKSHDLIDHLQDPASAHVHAYLHRKEKDFWNATYWYRKAKQEAYIGSYADEWEFLVKTYLY